MRGMKYYFFDVYLRLLVPVVFFLLIGCLFITNPKGSLVGTIVVVSFILAAWTIVIALIDKFGNETPDETLDDDNN